jgi:hypothetical protein
MKKIHSKPDAYQLGLDGKTAYQRIIERIESKIAVQESKILETISIKKFINNFNQ